MTAIAGAAAHAAPLSEWAAMMVALLASAAGIVGAAILYRRGPLPEGASPWVRVVYHKYYVDEIYDLIVLGPYRGLCRFSSAFDARIVDGVVNATAFTTDMAGEVMRLAQTGYVRNYALGFLAGAVLILYFVLR
jgi:NADH-quinone oxidoreductase subunit L